MTYKKIKNRIRSYHKHVTDDDKSFHTYYFKFGKTINLLEFMNSTSGQLYHQYFDNWHNVLLKKVHSLNDKEKKEYDRVTKFLKSKNQKRNTVRIKILKIQQLVGEHEQMHEMLRGVTPFMHEISLIYLITKFEEFLKDELKLLYKKQPKILASMTLTYKDALEKNQQELRTDLTEKQLTDLLHKDIEEIREYLDKTTKLDLTKLKNWNKFKERFYRRNIIVHNDGYSDEKYWEKIGKKKKNRMKVITSEMYLTQSLTLFDYVSHEITDFLEQKYGVTKFHKNLDYFLDSE